MTFPTERANRLAPGRVLTTEGAAAVRRPLHLILPLFAAAALVAAGCGSDNNDNSSSSGAKSTPAGKKIKVGLVTDIGGLNDRSFNQLAYQGLTQSEKTLGIQGRVLPSHANSDYIPNLSTLAQQHYDLVIGV